MHVLNVQVTSKANTNIFVFVIFLSEENIDFIRMLYIRITADMLETLLNFFNSCQQCLVFHLNLKNYAFSCLFVCLFLLLITWMLFFLPNVLFHVTSRNPPYVLCLVFQIRQLLRRKLREVTLETIPNNFFLVDEQTLWNFRTFSEFYVGNIWCGRLVSIDFDVTMLTNFLQGAFFLKIENPLSNEDRITLLS